MNNIVLIESLIMDLENLSAYDYTGAFNFKERAEMVLSKIYGEDSKYHSKLMNIRYSPIYSGMATAQYIAKLKVDTWVSAVRKTGNLFQIMIDEMKMASMTGDTDLSSKERKSLSNKVFIVHGHDDEMKLAVEMTIEKLGLEPIILHEQPNKGRTIIEKFTDYSNVGFAVVLLSPDDVGCLRKKHPDQLKQRARQNVILELGFFLGKLGRERVFPLYRKKKDKEFELPSDYDGVIYTKFSIDGGWKLKFVQELNAIGYNVDANKL